jgi:hypothetical protein
MIYYTHHKQMDAHRYAHADVSSLHLDNWMTYYKHHSNKCVFHYVKAYVYSDHLED